MDLHRHRCQRKGLNPVPIVEDLWAFASENVRIHGHQGPHQIISMECELGVRVARYLGVHEGSL